MIAFRLPKRLTEAAFYFFIMRVAAQRPPDFIVGADDPAGAYLRRWYITPWRGWYANVPEAERTRWQRGVLAVVKRVPVLYLHHFLRDDDDRALHDHPSWACSWMLRGSYWEHTIAEGGVHQRTRYDAGSLRFLPTRHAHRIELQKVNPLTIGYFDEDPFDDPARTTETCWTLLLFGPKTRDWGFHCPNGWVPWQEFTRADNPGEVGRGCE